MSEDKANTAETPVSDAVASLKAPPKDLEKALEIVGNAPDPSDEGTVAQLLIQAGFSLRKAGKLYDECLEVLGLRISPKDRREAVDAILVEMEFDPVEWSHVDAMVSIICDRVKNTDPAKALSAVRRWSEKNDIELPKKPRKDSGDGARGFRGEVFKWMIENTREDTQKLKQLIRNAKADAKNTDAMVKIYASTFELVKAAIAADRANFSDAA